MTYHFGPGLEGRESKEGRQRERFMKHLPNGLALKQKTRSRKCSAIFYWI